MDESEISRIKKTKMLKSWQDRATRASLAHYFQAQEYRTFDTGLTIFNLVAAISVLFLANNKLLDIDSNNQYQILLSIAGLAVVLSTTLQYVLRFEDKINDHKLAGNEFTEIKRKIEILLLGNEITEDCIHRIAVEHSHVAKNHRLVRNAIWEKIKYRHADAVKEIEDFINTIDPKVNDEEK